ncbi:MAG TPA: HmuY family protein [Gemmatimonadaceae bacterium]|nr:HmuY family protein [Gemmatimonadaceae bacterium]
MAIAQFRTRATAALATGFTLFVAAMWYLVASSLSGRSAPEFDPTPPGRARLRGASGDVDTLTIDARDARTWRFVTLTAHALLTPPDTTGWDLAVRRHRIIGSGLIADLGAIAFDSVTRAPRTGHVANRTGRDTSNAAIARWYRYSMLSHLLEPNGHLFAVRTTDGRDFKVQVLSYYCRGLEAGCLTIRYASLAPP